MTTARRSIQGSLRLELPLSDCRCSLTQCGFDASRHLSSALLRFPEHDLVHDSHKIEHCECDPFESLLHFAQCFVHGCELVRMHLHRRPGRRRWSDRFWRWLWLPPSKLRRQRIDRTITHVIVAIDTEPRLCDFSLVLGPDDDVGTNTRETWARNAADTVPLLHRANDVGPVIARGWIRVEVERVVLDEVTVLELLTNVVGIALDACGIGRCEARGQNVRSGNRSRNVTTPIDGCTRSDCNHTRSAMPVFRLCKRAAQDLAVPN